MSTKRKLYKRKFYKGILVDRDLVRAATEERIKAVLRGTPPVALVHQSDINKMPPREYTLCFPVYNPSYSEAFGTLMGARIVAGEDTLTVEWFNSVVTDILATYVGPVEISGGQHDGKVFLHNPPDREIQAFIDARLKEEFIADHTKDSP